MAGPNIYDQIINGSFDAVGAPAPYLSPPYNPSDYANLFAPAPASLPGMGGRGLPTDYQERMNQQAFDTALKGVKPQMLAFDAAGKPVTPTPFGWSAPQSPATAYASASPVQNEPAMGYAPQPTATPAVSAAQSLAKPVTNVTASMKPAQGGGLFDLLFGPSKNGMGGLAGLLGGPGSGGLLGLLMQPGKASSAPAAAPSGGLTPSQAYALLASQNNAASRESNDDRNSGWSNSGAKPDGTSWAA